MMQPFSEPNPKWSSRWVAKLLVLSLAACDLRDISAPNPITIPPESAVRNEAAPALLGMYSTPIEIADGPSAVTTYQPPRPAGIPIPANAYVLLRVSGRVRLVSGPWWPGPPEPVATYTAVQTTLATSRAQTRVWIRETTQVEPPTGGFEPRFVAAPDQQDRIALVRTGAVPAEVWTGRDMGGHRITATRGWCLATPWCSPAPGEVAEGVMWADRKEIEAYHVAESNTVSATLVPEPLHLDAPESVAPGQPAALRVRTWGGLRLRHPQIVTADTADVEWQWIPGDMAPQRDPGLRTHRLACTAKECEVTPGTTGGRVIATTWVEGARVEVSRVVSVQQQRVQLTCPGSVERGSTMTCTVAAVPFGTLDSVRWTFVDTAGHTVRDSLRLSWGGRMVVGGRMSVSANLNGSPVADEAVVGITQRTWPPITVIAADSGHGDLPEYPHVTHDLAHTHPPMKANPHDTELVSDGGPNTGWWYIKSPITQVRVVVHISSGFKPRSPFYRLQRSGVDPVTRDPFCSKGQLRQVEVGARQHEGLLSSATTSHIDVYKLWFQTNSPQVDLERYVMHEDSIPFGDLTFNDMVDNEFDRRISRPARNDPNQKHASESPPGLVPFPSVPCRPRFFP